MLPVAILAGGLATRMRPLTEKIPKALLPINGEPFLFHQLRQLAQHGVKKAVICVGHLGEQIEAALEKACPWPLAIEFSEDGAQPLGTGGALKKALPLLGKKFMVIYGDSWLNIRYEEAADTFLRSGCPAMMTVYKNFNQWDTSNAFFKDGLVTVYNKKEPHPEMKHIDYGLGFLSDRVFPHWPQCFDLSDLYTHLAAAGTLAGYEAKNRFYEIGSPQGFRETKELFMRGAEVTRQMNEIREGPVRREG